VSGQFIRRNLVWFVLFVAMLAMLVALGENLYLSHELNKLDRNIERINQSTGFNQNTVGVRLISENSHSGCPESLYFPLRTNKNGLIYLKKGQKSVVCTSFKQ
jgi:hypothetical protein